MIGHHYQTVEIELHTIPGNTHIDNKLFRRRREGPAQISAESYEEYFEVWLKVRQAPAIFVGVHIERFTLSQL